jgi:peptidoglycan/LPS O-acetylase OafA/YrhL
MRPLSHADFLAMKRFPALDGLRAVATILVFFTHFGLPTYGWLAGWAGVHIFFALSGFLITTLALREEAAQGRLSLPNFYVRRIFRIVPVYLVVLLLMYAVSRVNGGRGAAEMDAALPYYLTFRNESAPHAPFMLSWTLGIEQKFYLLWPILVFAGGRAFRRTRLLIVFGAAVVLHVHLTHYLVILTGCLMAVLMHSPRGFAAVRSLTAPFVGGLVLVGVAIAHLMLPRASAAWGTVNAIKAYTLPLALLLPTLVGAGPSRFLLSLRPLVFIGERSYSLYLIQVLVAMMVRGLAPGLAGSHAVFVCAVLVVALALADVLYRAVETPFINFGRRIVDRRRRRQPRIEPRVTSAAA